MSAISAKALGEQPNEIWMRTGQFLSALGGVAFIGFKGFGVEIASVNGLAPLVLIAIGILFMHFGTRMKKILHQARQAHEAELRKDDRGKPEPSLGDEEFLHWFRKQELPISRNELLKTPFPYDYARSHEELAASSAVRRADWWVNRGEISFIDGEYNIRDDRTIMVAP